MVLWKKISFVALDGIIRRVDSMGQNLADSSGPTLVTAKNPKTRIFHCKNLYQSEKLNTGISVSPVISCHCHWLALEILHALSRKEGGPDFVKSQRSPSLLEHSVLVRTLVFSFLCWEGDERISLLPIASYFQMELVNECQTAHLAWIYVFLSQLPMSMCPETNRFSQPSLVV